MRKARESLIVALDVTTPDEARTMIRMLGDRVGIYKIGLELIFAGGLPLVEELIANGHQVFIDAKLHDIGDVVKHSVARIAQMGAAFLTVHCTDCKTLQSAVWGRGEMPLKLFAITVLTNLVQKDLEEQGVTMQGSELVRHRARLALSSGFDGVIASGYEAAEIRKDCGDALQIIIPGIRPSWAETGDQARAMTPSRALSLGADYLVVGRPIIKSRDPISAAEKILEEMEDALFEVQRAKFYGKAPGEAKEG